MVTHCRKGRNPPKSSPKFSIKFNSLSPDDSDRRSCSISSETSCMFVMLILELITRRMQSRIVLVLTNRPGTVSSILSTNLLRKLPTLNLERPRVESSSSLSSSSITKLSRKPAVKFLRKSLRSKFDRKSKFE